MLTSSSHNLNLKVTFAVFLAISIAVCMMISLRSLELSSNLAFGREKLRKKNILMSTCRKVYPFAMDYDRKDWHDWKFIEYEKSRHGPGEQGQPVVLTDESEIRVNQKIFEDEGLFVVVSDKISVNRSVPDLRNAKCRDIQYLKAMPSTSVIVICHNEVLSVLLRTIHSIYNRTPRELLKEILIVNDASSKAELYEPLQNYVKKNFDQRVKIINLKERKGLIVTRMEGARRAIGEVLVFFDSHIEVNVNWLPPLLEPIAINPRTSTAPIIDKFKPDTFEYKKSVAGDGTRGVFDWTFEYHWLPRRPEDLVHSERPAPLPVMLGCAFAIRKDFFFDLGGYDEQLVIWNGENYELSFKLWLCCGGRLLEVPCSRVAHTFKRSNKYRTIDGGDFVAHNFKRIAEVWLDEYKQYLYRTDAERYSKADAGDLTRAKLIRKQLNCKPFRYFLEFVMPDMMDRYPLENRGVFASGSIRSEALPRSCVDIVEGSKGLEITLNDCNSNLDSQNFTLSWHRQIKPVALNEMCLKHTNLRIKMCTYDSVQQWFYNMISHQIVKLPSSCLTVNQNTKTLSMTTCKDEDTNQKWLWSYTNKTALEDWNGFGVKI